MMQVQFVKDVYLVAKAGDVIDLSEPEAEWVCMQGYAVPAVRQERMDTATQPQKLEKR